MKAAVSTGILLVLAACAVGVPYVESFIPTRGPWAWPKNTAVCFDSVGRRLFVADSLSDSVFVWDVAARRIVRGFAVCPGIQTMAWDAQLRRLVCGRRASVDPSGLVAVVDAATGRVVGEIELPATPTVMKRHPSGKYYFTLPDIGALAVVDAAACSLLATVPIGRRREGLLHNPVTDRLYAWVTDYPYDSAVVVIDCAADTIRCTIAVGTYLYELFLHEPDGRLYARTYQTRALTVVDPLGDTVSGQIALPDFPTCIASDPQRDYLLVGYRDSLCVVDPASGSVLSRRKAFHYGGGGSPFRPVCALPVRGTRYAILIGKSPNCEGALAVYDCANDTVILEGWSNPYFSVLHNAGEGLILLSDEWGIQSVALDRLQFVDVANCDLLEPVCVFCDAANGIVYGHGEWGGSVAVAVSDNLPVGWPWMWDCVTDFWSDNRTGKLYAARDDDDDLGALNVLDGSARVMARLEVGNYPNLLEGFGDGRLYCSTLDGIVAVDCLADTVLAARSLSRRICFLLAAPQVDRLIAVLGEDSTAVLVALDPATLATVAEADPRGEVVSACYDPAQRLVFVSCSNGAVSSFAAATLAPVAAVDFPTETRHLTVSPPSRKLYAAVPGDSLLELDAADLSTLRVFGVNSYEYGTLAWDPAYDRIYATEGRHATHVLSCRTGDSTAVSIDYPCDFAFWPDSGRVYVADAVGIAVLRDTSPRIGVSEAGRVSPTCAAATIVTARELLCRENAALFNTAGRLVARFGTGRSDLSTLTPGVYFLKPEDVMTSPARRFVLVR